MKIEVDLGSIDSGWETSIAEIIRDEVNESLRKEIAATVKKNKAMVEPVATGIVKTALEQLAASSHEDIIQLVTDELRKGLIQGKKKGAR